MLIIPAIDIKNGNCVMLTQGKADQETIFSPDPVAMAQQWHAQGAQRLHVVDLDGAFTGKPVNINVIKKIKQAVSLPLEVGGGIRDMKTLDALFSMGIEFAIIGSAAINDPEFLKKALYEYDKKIIVAADALKSKIMVHGWNTTTGFTIINQTRQFALDGATTVLYTDVGKYGMMQGPNWKGFRELDANAPVKIIASGGFSSLDDIRKIHNMGLKNIIGIIIGKALYTGDIALSEAITIVGK
jgi:phosphoribosylformimino-5-aminoimidazole carboxamide ribotide isomerase